MKNGSRWSEMEVDIMEPDSAVITLGLQCIGHGFEMVVTSMERLELLMFNL